MKFLRKLLDKAAPLHEKGGPLETLYPMYEAADTLLYTPGEVTHGPTHVREALDLKRMMMTVIVALLPCLMFALWNTGYQANHFITDMGASPLNNWQTWLYMALGGDFSTGMGSSLLHGAIYFIPVFAVTGIVGGHIEALFAVLRKHEINEGFLVTLFLFPMICPPTIPLWQVACGIAFGVIIGKEVFGGTGMNVLNPALTARAFLFFAYPGQISGDKPWIAADMSTMVDASSGATMLSQAASGKFNFADHALGSDSWMDAFLGFIPGSMGETSTIACLIGAAILIFTQIGSWRTMLGITVGTALTALLLTSIGSDTNAMFSVPFYWHFVIGGWAFGMVFMATDPVSSAFTAKGKLIYGFFIGMLVVLVRVVNPAYPEGMMLAILFMNMFAPLIDHFFVQANIKRRVARNGA